MKWIKIEDEDAYYCNTPIGRYDIVGKSQFYNLYLGIERISREKDLETAKEDARTHLSVTYYKIKLYLDL